MTLLSAYEDFSARTLNALRSAWEKLRYVSSLRENGRYRHWGMERTYGEVDAQAAILQAHNEVAVTILRRPLQQLDAELVEEDAGGVQEIAENPVAFSPEAGPVTTHLNSVAVALSELRRHPQSATGRAA